MKKNLLETMMKMLKEKFDVKRETQVQWRQWSCQKKTKKRITMMTTIVSMKSNSGNKNCSIGMKNKIKYNNDGAIALTCKNKDERKHHIDTMSPTNKTNTYK